MTDRRIWFTAKYNPHAKFAIKSWSCQDNIVPLHRIEAQMAESVDALVSNTSGATRAGSTPALGTSLIRK